MLQSLIIVDSLQDLVFDKLSLVFFFNDTATTEIYTLSLHDALPIFERELGWRPTIPFEEGLADTVTWYAANRSEEHTSELQSRRDLVCRLLLEKKKQAFRSPNSSTPASSLWPAAAANLIRTEPLSPT